MISKLLKVPAYLICFSFRSERSLFSTRAFRNKINASEIRNNKVERGTIHSVLKFDQLKAIYQKQPESTTINLAFENFEEIPELKIDLLNQMNKNGINRPTEIQKNMLGQFFASGSPDLLIKSRPGSGKSLGYAIMLLSDYFKCLNNRIEIKSNESEKIRCKYLIIVPSDLLAKQIGTWIEVLAKGITHSPAVSLLCETFEDLKSSKQSCDFLVATPEAFRTKSAQGSICLKELRIVVLDEADALIKPLKRYASIKQKEMRAKHPVTTMLLLSELFKSVASNKLLNRPRMIVASASLNKLTRDQLISAELVKNPVFLEDKQPILTRKEDLNPLESKVKHYHILLKDSENVNELVQKFENIIKSNLNIISTSGKRGAIFLPASQSKLGLCELLRSSPSLKDFSIGLLNEYRHQDQSQNSQILIASDVDCRGIDIPELAFVIILDLPASIENYIHMAGRVGRTSQDSGNVYTVLGTVEDFSRFSGLLRQIPLTSVPFLE